MMIQLVLMGLLALGVSAKEEQEVIWLELPEDDSVFNDAMMHHNFVGRMMSCLGDSCTACHTLDMGKYISAKVCASFQWIPDTKTADLKITINDKNFIHHEITLSPAPKLCLKFLPGNVAAFCATVVEPKIDTTQIGGCLKLDAFLVGNQILDKKPCFSIKLPTGK